MSERIELGIGPGIRIILNADGSPGWRGPSRGEVLQQAESRMVLGDVPEDKLGIIKRWIELMSAVLDSEEFEQHVEKAAAPRLKTLEKASSRLPASAIEPAQEEIRNQERRHLKGEPKW